MKILPAASGALAASPCRGLEQILPEPRGTCEGSRWYNASLKMSRSRYSDLSLALAAVQHGFVLWLLGFPFTAVSLQFPSQTNCKNEKYPPHSHPTRQ